MEIKNRKRSRTRWKDHIHRVAKVQWMNKMSNRDEWKSNGESIIQIWNIVNTGYDEFAVCM